MTEPEWLTEAIEAGIALPDAWNVEPILLAVLPILRAGIEAELREKIAAELWKIKAQYVADPDNDEAGYLEGEYAGLAWAARQIRGQS